MQFFPSNFSPTSRVAHALGPPDLETWNCRLQTDVHDHWNGCICIHFNCLRFYVWTVHGHLLPAPAIFTFGFEADPDHRLLHLDDQFSTLRCLDLLFAGNTLTRNFIYRKITGKSRRFLNNFCQFLRKEYNHFFSLLQLNSIEFKGTGEDVDATEFCNIAHEAIDLRLGVFSIFTTVLLYVIPLVAFPIFYSK